MATDEALAFCVKTIVYSYTVAFDKAIASCLN